MADSEAVSLGYVGKRLHSAGVRQASVGGTPRWFGAPPADADLACAICSAPLTFLAQLATSWTDSADRCLYVFGCGNGCCKQPAAWKVLRSHRIKESEEAEPTADGIGGDQAAPTSSLADDWTMSSGDGWGSTSAADDWGMSSSAPAADDWGMSSTTAAAADDWGTSASTSLFGGFGGTTSTSDADFENLVSQMEAVAVRTEDEPKVSKTTKKEPPKAEEGAIAQPKDGDSLCPCFEVDFFYEPYAAPKHGEKEKAMYEAYLKSEGIEAIETTIDASSGDAEKDHEPDDLSDKHFAKFHRRLMRSPTQILRYDWNGKPLFMGPPPKDLKPPPCGACGAARVFETQLMPALLTEVHKKRPGALPEKLDFGSVYIWTCGADCEVENGVEAVLVQEAV